MTPRHTLSRSAACACHATRAAAATKGAGQPGVGRRPAGPQSFVKKRATEDVTQRGTRRSPPPLVTLGAHLQQRQGHSGVRADARHHMAFHGVPKVGHDAAVTPHLLDELRKRPLQRAGASPIAGRASTCRLPARRRYQAVLAGNPRRAKAAGPHQRTARSDRRADSF